MSSWAPIKVGTLAGEYAEEAVNITRDAARLDPGEPEYRRWWASGLAHLAEAQAAADNHPAALPVWTPPLTS